MGHRVFFFLSLALLLIVSTTRHAQAAAVAQGMDGGLGSKMTSMVGSRPPSCAGRCWWCGGRSCVAVQVPITPQAEKKSSHGFGFGGRRPTRGSTSAAALQKKKNHHQQQQQQVSSSSYDDHSNYKPLSWRCKCGGGA